MSSVTKFLLEKLVNQFFCWVNYPYVENELLTVFKISALFDDGWVNILIQNRRVYTMQVNYIENLKSCRLSAQKFKSSISYLLLNKSHRLFKLNQIL